MLNVIYEEIESEITQYKTHTHTNDENVNVSVQVEKTSEIIRRKGQAIWTTVIFFLFA